MFSTTYRTRNNRLPRRHHKHIVRSVGPYFIVEQEYVLWNAVSVPLLQFAQYSCRGHVTLSMPTSEIFVRCYVGTIPGNTPAKFEVRIFSRFGAISI